MPHRLLILAIPMLAVIFALGAAPALAADATPSVTGTAPEPTPAERSVYGPIHSEDPLVRADIKRLYLELNRLDEETNAQLAALSEHMSTEADPDFRYEIQVTVEQLKEDHLRHSMEIGLEIARLNGDEGRVADFERALDQLLNPEKYRSGVPAEAPSQRTPPSADARN